jgi:hypothetical protein
MFGIKSLLMSKVGGSISSAEILPAHAFRGGGTQDNNRSRKKRTIKSETSIIDKEKYG